MANPNAPDESPAEIWFEQANNAAVYIGAIAYGIHMAIFFICAYQVATKRRFLRWMPLIVVLFSMATVNISMNIHFNEMAWIDNRNHPGGPLAFLLEQQASRFNTAGNASAFVATFLADGILVYRIYIVWMNWWIMIIPILMWLASAVLSVLTTVQAARPNSSLWASGTLDFSVPYWSLSIALNILLTLLLISRLLYMRHVIASTPLGQAHGKTYAGIAAMVLESALPYSTISIVFIILYGLQNTAADLFIPLLLQVACIAPELIILRVTRGVALSSELLSEARLSALHSDCSVVWSETAVSDGASKHISKDVLQTEV
ncbi:uncharacterized protein LAESUDRAFT_450793 [Laetiporus sulphureus 93-53]|uniref:Uncharacterized protein n=1 Tax=Laetiporus sulphureus 93-53 TaxID=1314785 RepID=A0A165BWN9_9APHY|nr:uncharacterized protein LAESUDRAFT_450793 [Laetiporus sulphureus 93-53]KZT01789.1 hypothetical protein LAESUDRAFT_450793 [Laetiporus sulphureus 93-53]